MGFVKYPKPYCVKVWAFAKSPWLYTDYPFSPVFGMGYGGNGWWCLGFFGSRLFWPKPLCFEYSHRFGQLWCLRVGLRLIDPQTPFKACWPHSVWFDTVFGLTSDFALSRGHFCR